MHASDEVAQDPFWIFLLLIIGIAHSFFAASVYDELAFASCDYRISEWDTLLQNAKCLAAEEISVQQTHTEC
jgi:hypothetical protein